MVWVPSWLGKIRDLSGFASLSDDMRERGLAPVHGSWY
jgi:hypothetical protein